MTTVKLYHLRIIYFYVTLFIGLVGASPFVRKHVLQSSTNASFVASLGCDDDMETFFLTNDAVNQWWYVELDNILTIGWIYVSVGTADYEMYVENTEDPRPFKYFCLPDRSKLRSLQRLVACKYPNFVIEHVNRITIRQKGNGSLKIFDVKPIGISPLSQTIVVNYTDSEALDGDFDTYYHSNEKDQASWFLKLDKSYAMKWILLSVRGGHYEIHVKDGDLTTSTSTLCRKFSFTGSEILKKNEKALECYTELTGNIIIIRRTDYGPMRLFELYPIICPENHYGPNCAKCKAECTSCSPITGVCFDSTCDQKTGICEGWKTEMATHSIAFDEDTPITKEINVIQEFSPGTCDRSCIACILEVQVCLLCTMHQLPYRCQYKCQEICSGETCNGMEVNCTRNNVEKNGFLDCRFQQRKKVHSCTR
ncbi:uncharacterized protein LOC125656059 [Ostrea edulis]|uniref:uncharacterized protein LOC125656059 n=1 Tax=Ostrea edulis TaxID=37623 RepID=UPI0024AF2FE9|nr:uncharacterized protein LOC125656059 [Ostrea edulis]